MRSNIYLIGGGELRNRETKIIDEEILSLSPKGSTFVFIGFASSDNTDYADAIRLVFGKQYNVIVPTVDKGKEFAINVLDSASVIYIGGGDTENLLRVFKEWGLVEHLRAAISRGVHVAGLSAGAQALSEFYIDEDGGSFELKQGWGIVPVGVLVHANEKSFNRAKKIWSEDGSYRPFVALGESAAWHISTSSEKIGQGKLWTIA